jgi:hypothetical protein
MNFFSCDLHTCIWRISKGLLIFFRERAFLPRPSLEAGAGWRLEPPPARAHPCAFTTGPQAHPQGLLIFTVTYISFSIISVWKNRYGVPNYSLNLSKHFILEKRHLQLYFACLTWKYAFILEKSHLKLYFACLIRKMCSLFLNRRL